VALGLAGESWQDIPVLARRRMIYAS